jgi:predicted NBD/HSP70 family sugar kinase/biotin operon repressor
VQGSPDSKNGKRHRDGQPASRQGSNQSGIRAYNERLVLSLIRQTNGLAQSQIAEQTGLSAQTISVIIRALEREGLLVRGTPQRGRVGQPSVPLSLNPEGVFSLGLMIGRRSIELILIDFVGNVRETIRTTIDYPQPEQVFTFAVMGVGRLIESLPERHRDRVTALGIATPFELWNWVDEIGAPTDAMESWRSYDIRTELDLILPFPVYLQNDATAACGAELMLGSGSSYSDYLYFFIGVFAGGGIVLNGSVYSGRSGNAGALGLMPIPGPHGTRLKLLECASLIVLERSLKTSGHDPADLWRIRGDWSEIADSASIDWWVDYTAFNLAHAIVSACCVIDFETVIIDGGFPEKVRSTLCGATNAELQKIDTTGIEVPMIVEGQVGSGARAIGAACLPLFERYFLDQTKLFHSRRAAD